MDTLDKKNSINSNINIEITQNEIDQSNDDLNKEFDKDSNNIKNNRNLNQSSFSSLNESFINLANEDTQNDEEDNKDSVMDSGRLRSLMKIIMKDYEDESNLLSKQKRLAITREKIFKAINKMKAAKMFSEKNSSENLDVPKIWYRIVMHPELSRLHILLDLIFYIFLAIDLIVMPLEILVLDTIQYHYPRVVIFDSIFLIELLSNFFTAYYRDQILIKECKSIAFNYLNYAFIFDISYIFPFWLFFPNLIAMRMIKIYKIPYLLIKGRIILYSIISHFIKSLKIIHSIINIIICIFILALFLHFSCSIWIFISRMNPEKNWLVNSNFYYFDLTNDSKWSKYIAGLYFLIETFASIGYGDLPPQTNIEIMYIMSCEIVEVGMYAYLISCIINIIRNLSTSEGAIKYENEFDFETWMINYGMKISKKNKEVIENEEPIFNSLKQYYLLYSKIDQSWITKFEFMKQMRPTERKSIMEYTFKPFFKIFNSFFSGLEKTFKIQFALNLKLKIYQTGSNIIVTETKNTSQRKEFSDKKKSIRYFYLIGSGIISVYKDDIEINRLLPGSYFGDEYLLNKNPQYSYKNSSKSDAYLFCCPVSSIDDLCSYDEQSYLFLLYKVTLRMNMFKKFYEDALNPGNKRDFSINRKNSNFEKNPSMFSIVNFLKKERNSKIVSPLISRLSINSRGNSFDNLDETENEILLNKFNEGIYDLNDPNEEFNMIITNLEYFNNMTINDENLGSMRKLNKNKENFQNYLQYTDSISKKFNFLKQQLDYLKKHFGIFLNNSNRLIDSIKIENKGI